MTPDSKVILRRVPLVATDDGFQLWTDVPVSPVFATFVELCDWCAANVDMDGSKAPAGVWRQMLAVCL